MKSAGEIIEERKQQLSRSTNGPVSIENILKLEFLRLPLPLLNVILFDNVFTKRQIKILLFIARFSIGCRRSTACLRQADFMLAGIHPSDIKRALLQLKAKGCIGWNRADNRLWIISKLLGDSRIKLDVKVGELLGRNLVKHLYKAGVSPTGVSRKDRYKDNKDIPIDIR